MTVSNSRHDVYIVSCLTRENDAKMLELFCLRIKWLRYLSVSFLLTVRALLLAN